MARDLPSLRALRVFEVAARTASFKLAARELHVTPAAVSRQIRELETRLGFDLFERQNRKVSITDRGSHYAEVVRNAFNSISSVTADLMGEAIAPLRLRLIAEREFAARWLLAKLGEFGRRQPGVNVEIIPATEITALPVNGPHGAITYGRMVQQGVRLEHLLALHAFPVCSPKFLTGAKPLRNPRDLIRYRLIHDRSTVQWKRWLAAAGVTGVDWSAGHIVYESTLAIEAALAEEGVAMGDNLLALRELEAGRLIKPFTKAMCQREVTI